MQRDEWPAGDRRERWRDVARDRKRADKTGEEGADKRKGENRGKLK